MLVYLKGYILITLGAAALIFGLLLLAPEKLTKDKSRWNAEQIKQIKRNAVITIIVAILVMIAGFVFRI